MEKYNRKLNHNVNISTISTKAGAVWVAWFGLRVALLLKEEKDVPPCQRWAGVERLTCQHTAPTLPGEQIRKGSLGHKMNTQETSDQCDTVSAPNSSSVRRKGRPV